jgi:crotonobetainyl-CoA:carnitine CoA-transferase CaiB-like acyl-CoA transferase
VGFTDLEKDPRYLEVRDRVENCDSLRAILAGRFRQKPAAHWLARIRGAGIPCGEVRTVAEALEDPHLAARGMIYELQHPKAGRIRVTGSPIHMPAAPPVEATPPPTHGQHNRQVFCGMLGLSDEEFELLARDRVI